MCQIIYWNFYQPLSHIVILFNALILYLNHLLFLQGSCTCYLQTQQREELAKGNGSTGYEYLMLLPPAV